MLVERTALALAGAAALCTVAAVGVGAGAFALYALAAPELGAAGAAGLVAGLAGAVIGAFAAALELRRRRRAREADAVRAQIMGLVPEDLAALAAERPLLSLAASLAGGVMLARHPGLARDLVAIIAAWARTRG